MTNNRYSYAELTLFTQTHAHKSHRKTGTRIKGAAKKPKTVKRKNGTEMKEGA